MIETFKLFASLNAKGELTKQEAHLYFTDDNVRSTLSAFVNEVDCTLVSTRDKVYMLPLTKNSLYHLSNDEIKRRFFPSRSLNMDIYLMYVAIIVLMGEFYDSYQSTRPTRDFITSFEWLTSLNERLIVLHQFSEEALIDLEEEYQYNWRDILANWEAMDNIKEGIKRATTRTVSRMSFIEIVKRFLMSQDLVEEIGDDELILTEKSHAIITQFFMSYEHNRGILEFLYRYERSVTS